MTEFSELPDASSKPWIQLSSFTALVFLLLTQNCSGLPQVVGPSQPILATVGGDVVLSCRLEPAVDASGMSMQWSREDLDPSYVYVGRAGEELESSKHPDYKGRTSLLFSELEFGDISLKLSKVKPSDGGKYRCFIPTLGQGSTVELVVGAVSLPVFSLAGLGRTSSSVELECKSAGWYPEPEVLWLDGDGNLLSAGPTKKIRGPDDLYTVSKRVTVEKKHGNKLTCRVQQNNINQNREALIQVTDDFFIIQSSYISTRAGLAVSLAAAFILLILAVVLFVRTRRQNSKMKTLQRTLQQEKQKNENLNSRLIELQDEKKKWTETDGKLKTLIQNMNKELEKQNWMKIVGNLKTELQNINQELKLTGSITLEEVNAWDHYIRLKNISSEEIKLGGWKLELQKNNRESAEYRFNKSVKLQAGAILFIRRYSSLFFLHPDDDYDVDLRWSDMMSWNPEDKLQIKLISNDGETFRLL